MQKENDEKTQNKEESTSLASELPPVEPIEPEYGWSILESVKVELAHPDARLPERQHESDACYDLYSVEPIMLAPGGWTPVSTGLKMEIPVGIEATIRPRSGLAMKYAVTVLNTPGTIDSGYRGVVKVILINHSRDNYFKAEKGTRIAQMSFSIVGTVPFEIVDSVNETERGVGGFGSTGLK